MKQIAETVEICEIIVKGNNKNYFDLQAKTVKIWASHWGNTSVK